jgi:hypothetical protein
VWFIRCIPRRIAEDYLLWPRVHGVGLERLVTADVFAISKVTNQTNVMA